MAKYNWRKHLRKKEISKPRGLSSSLFVMDDVDFSLHNSALEEQDLSNFFDRIGRYRDTPNTILLDQRTFNLLRTLEDE